MVGVTAAGRDGSAPLRGPLNGTPRVVLVSGQELRKSWHQKSGDSAGG